MRDLVIVGSVTGKETHVERYWKALGEADGATMAECYHEDAIFDDPVFSLNGGRRIGAMWKTLLGPGNKVKITTGPLSLHPQHATGQWEAVYTVGDRKVVNKVQSVFTVRDGRIAGQQDSFTFWKWSRQAFGWTGVVFGWSPVLRRVVRYKVTKRIEAANPAPAKPETAPTGPKEKPWTRLLAKVKTLGKREKKEGKKGEKVSAKPATKPALKPKAKKAKASG